MKTSRRSLLAYSLGAVALAANSAMAERPGRITYGPQRRAVPHGMVKTTRLFKAPPGYVNALAVAPQGLWLGQQKLSGRAARQYHLPDPKDLREAAWLVDWSGKLLKTVETNSRNTSGMAYGDGCVWMMANQEPEGCFQHDMSGRQISHRQIPLGLPGQDGGGSHGAQWHNGKLWIVANRPRLLLRVDPKSWAPEVAIPIHVTAEKPRWHDMTFDAEGNIWQVTGNDSKSYREGRPGLVKYDGKTGAVMATYDFASGSCDPHGLEFHNGTLISCDAGIHPGWPNGDSPHAGWVFKIEMA
ncbi:MAG: hypothetical protein BGN85_08620 [Alphaproteobacteria bacterium 64-11]|nr:hypothetical protein [Alphaproteobacteria bacterium]OJU14144.1 MAG: hypothetical protein BGN85_08620 [Alphaproteobacteria bacterium 64-11]